MSDWRVANCILELQKEVNAKWPTRNKASDGTIGDVRHQNETQSDHNPNSHGVVTAWDITTEPWSDHLAHTLANSNDPRVKYVIWNRHIWSTARKAEGWRTYTGSDPHTNHIHLSVSADPAQYDRTDPWHVLDESPKPDARPFPGTLSRGMDNPHVAELNARFNLGHSTKFGDDLNQKVRTFQSQHHLTVDGTVGPNTWAAIWY